MEDTDRVRRRLEFVVKISKLCNLRCRYCYELHDLHKKERMSLEDMRRMFTNIASYAAAENYDLVQFIWHGGEPLLIKPSYYLEIAAIQRAIFEGICEVRNTVQTNLTVLTDDILELVGPGRFFGGLGVSFDPYGTDRVDTKGRLKDDQVIRNLQTLMDRDVPFGIVTVLSRGSLASAVNTFNCFDALGVNHRFLPYYMRADDAQAADHSLTYEEIRDTYVALVDAWLVSKNATVVDPIEEYMIYVWGILEDRKPHYFDAVADEFIFIVEVDGGIWGVNGAYDPNEQYGNIFEESLRAVLSSQNRQRLLAEIEARKGRTCCQCEFYGHCSGKYVAHATQDERHLLDTAGCLVRDLMGYIRTRFDETGLAARQREPRQAESERVTAL